MVAVSQLISKYNLGQLILTLFFWWSELDYPYKTELGDLRAFAMKFLGQKTQGWSVPNMRNFYSHIISTKIPN